MSTRSILTVVGGVVGAYFGYPQLGLTIGALVGSAVDPQQIQGPRIGEVAAQTSQEGAPRTIVYGTIACFGNIIQTGQVVKVETSESQGKGGGPEVTSERALRTYAIRICEGPIGGVLRIWADNKLVYDVRPDSGMSSESSQWISNKTIYLGDETQTPDPTLVASVNSDTPSYRGTAYIVFVQEDLTDRTGSIPQYRFEVAQNVEPPIVEDLSSSITVPVYVQGGLAQYQYVYMNYLVSTDPDANNHVAVNSLLTVSWPKNGATPYKVHELDETCTIVQTNDIFVNNSDGWSSATSPAPSNDFFTLGSYGSTVLCMGTNYPTGEQLYLTSGGGLRAMLTPTALSSNSWFADNTAEDRHIGRYLWMNSSGVYLGVRTRSATVWNSIFYWPLGSSGFAPDFRVNSVASVSAVCVTPGNHFYTHLGRDGKLRVINDAGTYAVYSAILTLESTQSLPFSISGLSSFGVDGDVACFSYTSSGTFVVRHVSDWSLQDTFTNSTINTKPNNQRIVFTEDSVYLQCQDTVLRALYAAGSVGSPAILADIVADIHDRCGIESTLYDVSELPDEVEGFSLSGDYTGASAVDALRTIYFFDKSEHDKQLFYPKRGAAVIETLTIDDLTEVPDNTRRNQAIEVPKKLHLRYQHARSGYAPVKATAASSSPDFLTTGEVAIETAVVLDENEAAQTADKMYKITRTEIDGPTEITVPLNVGARYVTANNIGLSLRGQTSRLRLEQIDFADWKLKFTLKPDRQSAYTSNLTGVPIPEPTLPPSTIVGDTELAVLDISARVDSEDDLNYLVAVTGRLPPWYGARYQRSLNGGSSYTTVLDINTASIMGELTASMTDASEFYTDTYNTIHVELYRDGQSLESITDEEFLSQGNPCAVEKSDGSWELMQFQNAVQNSDGTWTLSVLHRGQLNSGTSTHAAGDRFVMLQRPSHIAAQSACIGQDLTHRAISFGETADDTDNEETQTYVGRSQIEWEPAYLELSRDGSNNVSGTWVGRGRFGTGLNPVMSINFQGYRIVIDDGSTSVTFDTTDSDFTYDASAMSAPVTVSVSAINRITGAGPASSGTI